MKLSIVKIRDNKPLMGRFDEQKSTRKSAQRLRTVKKLYIPYEADWRPRSREVECIRLKGPNHWNVASWRRPGICGRGNGSETQTCRVVVPGFTCPYRGSARRRSTPAPLVGKRGRRFGFAETSNPCAGTYGDTMTGPELRLIRKPLPSPSGKRYMTQKEFGEILGLSKNHVWRLETGRIAIRPVVAEAVRAVAPVFMAKIASRERENREIRSHRNSCQRTRPVRRHVAAPWRYRKGEVLED